MTHRVPFAATTVTHRHDGSHCKRGRAGAYARQNSDAVLTVATVRDGSQRSMVPSPVFLLPATPGNSRDLRHSLFCLSGFSPAWFLR